VVVLGALATSHKIGILIMAGCFIAFALVSSFVLPAIWPDFPGKRLRLYLVIAGLFTVGMLTTIIVLAKEPKESEAATGTTTTATTTTSTATTSTSTTATTTAPSQPAGNAAAGKTLFASQGCSACHTFTPAGATGTVGPNLDHLAADAQKANRGPLDKYATESITDPSAYVVPGFPNGVMPSNFAQMMSPPQIADLVAFITGGK
jgi:mono/diheme cytochrome c family protein